MSTSFDLKCDVLLYKKWKKQGLELQINFNLGQVLQAPRWHSQQQLLDQAILLIWDHIIAKEKLSRFYKTKPFFFSIFSIFFFFFYFLMSGVWEGKRPVSGQSGFWKFAGLLDWTWHPVRALHWDRRNKSDGFMNILALRIYFRNWMLLFKFTAYKNR